MTETAKERIYREALEVLRGISIKSYNKILMFDGRALSVQEYLEEKLRDAENLPDSSVSTDKVELEKLQERCDRYEKALKFIIRTI